jgi:hypothetical protein
MRPGRTRFPRLCNPELPALAAFLLLEIVKALSVRRGCRGWRLRRSVTCRRWASLRSISGFLASSGSWVCDRDGRGLALRQSDSDPVRCQDIRTERREEAAAKSPYNAVQVHSPPNRASVVSGEASDAKGA